MPARSAAKRSLISQDSMPGVAIHQIAKAIRAGPAAASPSNMP